ncbi:MAG: hypothetical protein NC222_06625 [Staphylococcus sp.]|nr:hypothetical protein [Staphylococcus sp.]
MDPVTNSILQGRPFAGMGTNLERVGLQKVLKNIIEEGKYSVKFIIDYAVGLGYQRQMAIDTFQELTGLDPALIEMNNEYLQNPSFVPGFTIAWGFSKNKTDEAHYVVPFEYGFGVMRKNETEVPELVAEFATINEAVDELKSKVTKVFTADKIITEELLKSETIQLNSNSLHSVDNPYFSDPVRELKKRYRNKLINLTQLGDEIFKLSASQEISEGEIKDLVTFKQNEEMKQELNEEPELTKNREDNVDFLTEEARYLKGEELPENLERAYQTLKDMISEEGALDDYMKTFKKGPTSSFKDLVEWVASEEGVSYDALMDYYVEQETGEKFSKKQASFKSKLSKQEWSDLVHHSKDIEGETWTDSGMGLVKILSFSKTFNGGIEVEMEYLDDSEENWEKFEMSTKEPKLYLLEVDRVESSLRKQAASEDITLEDINEEENKSPLDEATERALNSDTTEEFEEETPQDYFDDSIKENVTTKMSDKVAEIIETFVGRFGNFDKYEVKLNSYKVKTIEQGQEQFEDVVNDVEIDCQSLLQIIVNINPVEDLTNIKKCLAVFSIDGNKVYWNGTVKAENNYFYAFNEEGLDALFKEIDEKEEIIEDII